MLAQKYYLCIGQQMSLFSETFNLGICLMFFFFLYIYILMLKEHSENITIK